MVASNFAGRKHGLRVLIIGSSGFIGTHLAAHLQSLGHGVEGWGRRLRDPGSVDDYHSVDLLSGSTLEGREGPWGAAVLLAGHSVPGGFTQALALENQRMWTNALDHLARVSPGLRVLVASSAHVYDLGPGRRLEDEPLQPQGLYGLSKERCEDVAQSHADRLDVQVVRLFNQLGPGLPAGLVVPDLLVRLRTSGGVLAMRGANSVRDFLDVRDGVRALAELLTVRAPIGSVWNLCSGQGYSIERLARTLVEQLGMDRDLEFASADVTRLVGDPGRLREATGWAPEYSLAESLASVIEADRASPKT